MTEIAAQFAQHPYLADQEVSARPMVADLVSPDGFASMAKFQADLAGMHHEDPIALLVADDVSGRVPTLIAHRLLRYGLADGQYDTIPRTLFVASGKFNQGDGGDRSQIEKSWTNNLTDHAKQVAGHFATGRTMIVTDIVQSGDSIERIKSAFEAAGNRVPERLSTDDYGNLGGLGLGGVDARVADRRAVGVEKVIAQPLTHRHPQFDGRETAQLRGFLADYSRALYREIHGTDAPQELVTPNYLVAKPAPARIRAADLDLSALPVIPGSRFDTAPRARGGLGMLQRIQQVLRAAAI